MLWPSPKILTSVALWVGFSFACAGSSPANQGFAPHMMALQLRRFLQKRLQEENAPDKMRERDIAEEKGRTVCHLRVRAGWGGRALGEARGRGFLHVVVDMLVP